MLLPFISFLPGDDMAKLNVILDQETNDLVLDRANKMTGGNTLAMLRIMILGWLEQEINLTLPESRELLEVRWLDAQREEGIKKLHKDWLDLEERPNPRKEELCRKEAERLETAWPPIDIKKWEVDRILAKVLDAVRILANDDDIANIRDIYRRLSMNKDNCCRILRQLEECGQIEINWTDNEVRVLS